MVSFQIKYDNTEWDTGFILPSSRYRGLDEYKVRETTANLIFSNCLPLIPVRLESLSLVSLKTSPY